MANLYDQFDAEPPAQIAGNPYDRFDVNQTDGFRAPSDLRLLPYEPTVLDRTRNFLRPLTNIITKLGTPPEGLPQIPSIPAEAVPENRAAQIGAGVVNTGISLVNSLPTPVGVGLMLGGLPARLTGSLMSPVMAQQAADNLSPTIDVVRNPNATVQQKTEAVLGEALLGAGALAPLAGMRRGPMQQTRNLGTVDLEVVDAPGPRRLSLPEPLMERVAEKTPEQAVKAIREEIKLIEEPKKKAQLVDEADKLDRQIAARDAAIEREQQALDAQEAQLKIIQDQQKAVENQAKAQQKAQENAQKLAIEQAKAQGEQVQAIMDANTPPEPLQASKPMVLANSAAQSAKAIENNPETAQAQLNAITAPNQSQSQNAIQVQGADAQMLRQPETQPQNTLALQGLGEGNAQSKVASGARSPEEIVKDRKSYDELQAKLKPGDFGKPEFQKAWAESETIKNKYGGMPPPVEIITSAAIRTTDGQIVPGRIHAEAFNAAEDAGLRVGSSASDEGFITSTGRYVTRQEAMKIAKDSGQNIKQPKGREELFVEHLDEGVNVLPGRGLTAEEIRPSSAANEPAQAASAPQAPGAPGVVPDPNRVADPATDIPPPDNLANRRAAAFRRQQRGAVASEALGSAGGAASGAALGFVTTERQEGESDEAFQTRRLIRALLGGLGGGVAGNSAVRLFGRPTAVKNTQTLAKIQAENRGLDTMPKWYQSVRQTAPMVKFREAINNSRAIVKDMVGNAAQEGTEILDQANPYAMGKVYAAKVAESQRKAKLVMDDLQAGVVEAGKASGIGVDNFINRFNVWMEARHTPDYNKHLADMHKAAGGVGAAPIGRLTDAEALQVLADAKTDGFEPVFSNLRTGYRGVIDSIRDLLEDGGLITPETRKIWEDKFPEYIPMNRVMPDADLDSAIIGHIGGGPGLSVLGSGVRKIKGSDLDVSDIAGNLMANWSDAITRVEKNEVAKSAGYFFKNLDFDGNPFPGVEVRTPKVIGTSGDKPIYENFRPDNMLSYMVKGKPHWVVFTDPKMAQAFSNLNSESQNRLMRLISVPTRVLSRAFTGYNLDFLLPNLVRDRQSAAWKALSQGDISGALQQVNPTRMAGDPAVVAQWVAGKQTPDTALFQQMMDDGGMPGGYASSTRQKSQDFVEMLRRADTNPAVWTVQKTKQVFNFLSEISEGSTRFRAYKRALELGATRQEAAVQALNSSIDFNQKGTLTPSMGAFFAFFNPAQQGGVNAAKNMLRSKEALAVTLASLVAVGVAVDAWNKSFDPDWKKRKGFAHARTNSIPIIYGTDPETKELKYFSMPLSQEIRPLKAMMDFGQEMSNGEIQTGDNLQEELARVGGAVVTGANPLGANPISNPLTTITPTAVRPLVEIASNRDYADRPIIPDRLATSPFVQRQAQRNLQTYESRTGRMAIKLSELLKENFNVEVSPEHMKYLVNSYGGGPARLASSTVNSIGAEPSGFKSSDLPVVGSFMRRTTEEGLERTTPLYKQTEEKLSEAKTQAELALQQSKLFFKHTFDKLEPQQWAPFWRQAEAQGLLPQDPTFRRQIINDLTDKIKGRGDVDKLVAQFGVQNGERAAYYASRKRDFKTEQEYLEFLQDQAKKKLLTAEMVPQIKAYLDAGK